MVYNYTLKVFSQTYATIIPTARLIHHFSFWKKYLFIFFSIFGVRVIESQWKSSLNDWRFISNRNLWIKQALSAAVNHNDAVHIRKIQQILQETKCRAQEFNIRDELLNSRSYTV